MADIDIDESERFASAILGGMLVLAGMGRRSMGGLAVASLGAALVMRGVTGRSVTAELGLGELGLGGHRRTEREQHDDERVTEASEESFPASDAPSWTPTTSTGAPDHRP